MFNPSRLFFFSIQLLYSHLYNFYMDLYKFCLFADISNLLIYHFLISFSYLFMFSFSSLSIFKTIILKSLSSKSNAYIFSGTVSTDYFVLFNVPYIPLSLYALSYFIENWALDKIVTFPFADWLQARKDIHPSAWCESLTSSHNIISPGPVNVFFFFLNNSPIKPLFLNGILSLRVSSLLLLGALVVYCILFNQ